MAQQPIAGAAGPNGEVPQEHGAAAVLPAQIGGGRVRAAGQAAVPVLVGGPLGAPVAGPPVAPVAGALFPRGLAPARFDVDGALLGPLPTKSNGSCKILPKIADGIGP